jgi:hypothetical protein
MSGFFINSYPVNNPMRFIWPNASNKPRVIKMAKSVKRFIVVRSVFYIPIFLALICLAPKALRAQMITDTVLSTTPPFEVTLKKSGKTRLASLLFDPNFKGLGGFLKPDDRVKIHILNDKPDRYGRKAVHLYLKDGTWLQALLVREGKATAFPYAYETQDIRNLYEFENLTDKQINALSDNIKRDQFSIISGTIVDVAHIRNTTYLNFGANWRKDFTIKINPNQQRLYRENGFDLLALKGQTVRIRGWVFEENGPMINPDHPSQIEIIPQ